MRTADSSAKIAFFNYLRLNEEILDVELNRNIIASGELDENATAEKISVVQTEGAREVSCCLGAQKLLPNFSRSSAAEKINAYIKYYRKQYL